ncbi:MAG TPA: DUF1571 domain-containing protein [Pirellulales bacterium]|jgi:outer membrane lipoprotein-sorting protein
MIRQLALVGLCLVLTLIASGSASAATPAPSSGGPIGPPPGDLTPQPGEHPLAPIIRWGKTGIAALEKLEDYSCRLVKRERVGGKLTPYQALSVKMRQRPFSVYAAFTNKQERPYQEVVYVDGRDGGKMFVHSDEFRLMGTVSLFPDSDRAMRDNRYPLTEMGILKLIQRLVEHAESDSKFDDCEVKIYKDAKIESRPCLYIRVTHKTKRPEFSFHMARIFIDNELNVPVRYEAYTWPDDNDPKAQPPLIEEYTYVDFQFNVHFTERDFDYNNPDYYFPPDFGEPEVDIADIKPVSQPPAELGNVAKQESADQPLTGVVAVMRDMVDRLAHTSDYTCLVSHRVQATDQADKYENLHLKVRHDPMSIYAFFLGPKTHKGQEAIYNGKRADGTVLVHTVAPRGRSGVNRQLHPDSPELLGSTGEPFNQLGIKSHLERWLAMYQAEMPLGDSIVKYYPQVEVDQRLATCIEVSHAKQRPQFRYQKTRLYIDADLKLPVRFEAYGWPAAAGQPTPLAEEFNYRNIELNRGLTDQDFDPANPNYAFESAAPSVRSTSSQ